MRFKAISDDFGKNAKRNFVISIIISFVLIAILLILFQQHTSKPDFDIILMFMLLIGYSVLAFPNMFWFVISSVQLSTIKSIGRNRYLNLCKDGFLLEDNINDKSIYRTYSWQDIKRIVIRNVTPINKFNKNKIYTVTLIIDNSKYEEYQKYPKHRDKKLIEYLGSFITVMHSQSLIDEIKKYWSGTVTKLSEP